MNTVSRSTKITIGVLILCAVVETFPSAWTTLLCVQTSAANPDTGVWITIAIANTSPTIHFFKLKPL